MNLLNQLKEESTEGSNKDDKKRIKQLESEIERLQEQVERSRKPRVRLNPGRVRQQQDGDFIRVIIPDTHGCFVDPDAIKTFLADLEILQPKEIIMIGDHLDCGGFLAQHHTLGYVAEADYTYDYDIECANALLDQVQSICPDSSIDYLYGNHEQRVEKWCVTQALRNAQDAERLRKQNAPEYVLNLEKRGIEYYRTNIKYDGLSTPGVIKRGHCYFVHGTSHAKHAAMAHVSQFCGNVVFGHIHRIQSFATRNVNSGVACGWSVGCLCKLQPMYRHTSCTDWAHGYGVQFCQADGKFQHITCHIVEGESFLVPMMQAIGVN